jgi:CHAD domain-containing protein
VVKGIHGKGKISIPPHLAHSSWINYEALAALSVLSNLKTELKALKENPDARRVHKARVSLRRWFSIWAVLREDGWETKSFKKEVSKPLRRLLRMLGGLRDSDVNLELVESLQASERFAKLCRAHSRQLRKELRAYLPELKLAKILKLAKDHLHSQAEKVEKRSKRRTAKRTAFDHLDEHVCLQEEAVKRLALTAESPEELHQLRLAVKRWRYLLTEFFGLTNLELVTAQTLLGHLHDLDRLSPILRQSEEDAHALSSLKQRRRELLRQFQPMRSRLPYGLRPRIVTLKPAQADNTPEDIN